MTDNNTITTHTFISLANLDLGITTCFYNGMDNYAKMWLQLMFPAYLILIAAVFIIASRHSAKIQQITACKALPVLATLFLLSYTKVLLAVSRTLFFYSTITHLPSNHTTVLWSIDAMVPLFGLRFIILFIACFILFIVLIPFNILLVFTRQLSRFRRINYFKPLLDAYQGPYKNRFYFWTGLQLLLRAIIFGLSALERNVNLFIGNILFGILIWLTGKYSPFKSQKNNTFEALYLLNLLIMFTSVISLHKTTSNIITNISISLAMFKLLFIVVLHVKDFLCSTDFWRCKLTDKFTNCFQKSTHTNNQQRNFELNNPAPEIAYNYKEFQEPLIGQD